jgi:hypothetical protein
LLSTPLARPNARSGGTTNARAPNLMLRTPTDLRNQLQIKPLRAQIKWRTF